MHRESDRDVSDRSRRCAKTESEPPAAPPSTHVMDPARPWPPKAAQRRTTRRCAPKRRNLGVFKEL